MSIIEGKRNIDAASVDFRDDMSKVELKIENESRQEAILYPSRCYAIRKKRQARCFYPVNIKDRIPPGVVEEGNLSFETIDHTGGIVVFYFDFSIGTQDVTLSVEVDLD